MDDADRHAGHWIVRWAYRREDEPASPVSHVVMFWILLASAAGLFGASILVPVWQDHQEVLAAKAQAQQRVDSLRQELARKQAIAEALEDDPIVNEHTALRDFNYHLLGREVIHTHPETVVEIRPEGSSPAIAAHRPAWLPFVPDKWLRVDTWIEEMRRPDVRRGMLLAAAFLTAVAMVIFAPPAPGGVVSRLLGSLRGTTANRPPSR
jgi:hypothetical protein